MTSMYEQFVSRLCGNVPRLIAQLLGPESPGEDVE